MTEQELRIWLAAHDGYAGEKQNTKTRKQYDRTGTVIGEEEVIDSITYTAQDGATITVKRRPAPDRSAQVGPQIGEVEPYEKVGETPPKKADSDRDPSQIAVSQAQVQKAADEREAEIRLNNERSYNQQHPDEYGVALPETHIERAQRIAKRKEDERQQAATQQQIEASRASTEASRARIEQDRKELEVREREGAAGRALTARQVAEQERQGEYTRNKPEFLSRADKENQYVVRYDPVTGGVVSEQNPNYDAVKAAAEEKRAELAAQIQARRMTLDEGTQAYKQWFDSNVQIPMLQAQEARARAEERRQALEAEERRRQFAADYKLRKAQLGETAANRATQAEISLLPYRAGPTAAAEMSSAINSLAAGGKISGPDASAGINFTPEAFQFSRPDFKQIAKDAMKSVLGGLTDYRPSDQEFSVGDYSGIPAINPSGAPSIPGIGAYQLPTPTPGADQPIP